MNHQSKTFAITDFSAFRLKMLDWANRFSIFCLLDNQHYNFNFPAFECLLGAGCKASIECNAGNAFDELKKFHEDKKSWLMGHLGYGLKNETEKLASIHKNEIGFADMFFFIPEFLIRLKEHTVEIFSQDAQLVFNEINIGMEEVKAGAAESRLENGITIQSRLTREHYVTTVKKLQQHILRGDCYEINFCQEFFANDCLIGPLHVYHQLTEISPNPFCSFYKQNDKYCICASPERYLKKEGNRVISQPIKGTSKRDISNRKNDLAAMDYLLKSAKEKAENVMVVDLVRNDLSRVCREGSVKVEELFGIYSFPQVHQMISTVSGELKDDIHFADAISATFPMGSMTGAPKKRVMELIEEYETTGRGLFSGSIGYISPEGNFDFNVVIRSILYNATKRYLSFETGSAITFYCDAEQEYDECLLKANAIVEALNK